MTLFRRMRTYHVRDYGPIKQGESDPDDYNVVVGKLSWEQARKWVDDHTTDETAGSYVIHADVPPTPYMVCIVLEDRAYGGPEEGGWWYDTFNPNDPEAQWLTHEAGGPWLYAGTEDGLKLAQAHARLINAQIKAEFVNDGRPDISSVNSHGRYAAYIYEGYPHYIPRETPHYE